MTCTAYRTAAALALGMFVATGSGDAQDLGPGEAGRVASYAPYWELADRSGILAGPEAATLEAAVDQARMAFGGRGSALAAHFLRRGAQVVDNSAYFFLFRAVGDEGTARLLIAALLDPPLPEMGSLAGNPYEVSVALEAILGNESVRTAPATLQALDDAYSRARERGRNDVAEIAILLIGRCGTPEAGARLKELAADVDSSLRTAAVRALGETAGAPAAEPLQHSLAQDPEPDTRAAAAAALGRGAIPGAAGTLREALESERHPQVLDEILRSLAALGALPDDPRACLALATRGWDPPAAQAPFSCWLSSATATDLLAEATSGSYTVRALAVQALTQSHGASPPARMRLPLSRPIAAGAARSALDGAARDRVFASLVEMLSQPISGRPLPGTISHSTAALAREALWEAASRDMSSALAVARRITPISGRYSYTGRFGTFLDLASRDRAAYTSSLRPAQLLAAGAAALLVGVLWLVKPLRPLCVGLLMAIGIWAAWFSLGTDSSELPPLPLAFLTMSAVAFLTAGVVSGLASFMWARGWVKVGTAVAGATVAAFFICAFTRSASLFPVGGAGLEMIIEPIGSAVLAAPAAFFISLFLLRLNR